MEETKFYQFGKTIYTCRWVIIALWILSLLTCVPFIPNLMSPFKTTGFVDEHAPSTKTTHFLNQHLGFDATNQFLVIYHSKKLFATNDRFIQKIKKSLSDLKHFPFKAKITYPNQHPSQISKNKHTAYAVVIIKDKKPMDASLLAKFKSSIKTPHQMSMQFGGDPVFIDDMNHQTQTDLFRSDFIATPVAIITLILVFGSLIAAALPIVLGGGAALLILTVLYGVGSHYSLSIFTINIALLLGLCLCLDYALFIISRFRDELRKEQGVQKVIAITQATAGKAIFYSGMAVFASLSALFIFPINILFSVAVGGVVAVFVAVFSANVVLPALLSILGPNINRFLIKIPRRNRNRPYSRWHWIAGKVVNRPLTFFFPVLIFLLLLGYPFLSVKPGISDFHIFPEHSTNRQFFDTYTTYFNENTLSPIRLVVTSNQPILSKQNISKLYTLSKTLKRNSSIAAFQGIVTPDKKLTNLQRFYHLPISRSLKSSLSTTTASHFTVFTITGKPQMNSPQMTKLIHSLQNLKPQKGQQIQLAGTPIANHDVLKTIYHLLPYAMLWIVVFTYLILLMLLRSVFLPIKAILMNLLSLSACYGALVLVFQEGHLHQLLHFQPQGMLDISLMVIIFCALFGFSMDYEVFLLTRIKEAYELTKDNKQSIIFGIEKSSRIISCAAIIVIFICGSFLVAEVLMVKAFGFGIAVAIFVDAFLIRSLLVPSTMSLMNQWNWAIPKWLDKILPRC